MTEKAGDLRCEGTGMPLSQSLRRALSEVFIDHARSGRRHPDASFKLRHPFFCPGCGVQMTAEGCPRCGAVLDEFAHQIVELHPHA